MKYFICLCHHRKRNEGIPTPDNNEIVPPNDVTFNINKKSKLYQLNNLVNSLPSNDDDNNVCETPTLSKTLEEWHYILGYCNVPDLLKLEKIL